MGELKGVEISSPSKSSGDVPFDKECVPQGATHRSAALATVYPTTQQAAPTVSHHHTPPPPPRVQLLHRRGRYPAGNREECV